MKKLIYCTLFISIYISTFIQAQINDQVKFRNTNTGIKNVMVLYDVGNSLCTSTLTSSSGSFSCSANPYNYTSFVHYDAYKPNKDIPVDGVTAYDIVLTNQFILNTRSLNLYQALSADVNVSGTVTAYDMALMQQLILLTIPSFPDINGRFWHYIPESLVNDYSSWFNTSRLYSYSGYSSTLDYIMQSVYYQEGIFAPSTLSSEWGFKATKPGDINGNANTQNIGTPPLSSSRSREKEYELSQNKTIEAGESFEIHVTAKNFKDIVGYQIGANFTIGDFELTDIRAGDLDSFDEDNFGLTHLDRGEFRTLWFDEQKGEAHTLKNGEALFILEAKALKDIPNLKQSIRFVNRVLKTEFYTQDGGLADVNLKLDVKSNFLFSPIFNAPNRKVASSLKNYPNPFTNDTTISFESPNQEDGILKIKDIAGNIIFEQFLSVGKGYNEYILSDLNLPQGMLFYTLQFGEYNVEGKMLKVR